MEQDLIVFPGSNLYRKFDTLSFTTQSGVKNSRAFHVFLWDQVTEGAWGDQEVPGAKRTPGTDAEGEGLSGPTGNRSIEDCDPQTVKVAPADSKSRSKWSPNRVKRSAPSVVS